MKNLSNDVVTSAPFTAFLDDLVALGVTLVSEGGRPFAVIGARSNARWWLVPLDDPRAGAVGLEMFHPVTTQARLAKSAFRVGLRIGASGFLGCKQLRFVGAPDLRGACLGDVAAFAYFTGTDGPHRKTSIQAIGPGGRILGYGKMSREARIRRYLRHEAQTLRRVKALSLTSADAPDVLAFEDADFTLLVTDSQNSSYSGMGNSIAAAHKAFLKELSSRTWRTGAADAFEILSSGIIAVAPRCGPDWENRLAACKTRLAPWVEKLPVALAHGDFTPWNVFRQKSGKALYVFDWEYAQDAYPVGYDLTHFMLSLPKATRFETARLIDAVAQLHFSGQRIAAVAAVLFSVALHAVFYIQRAFEAGQGIDTWEDSLARARLIDSLLSHEEAWS